MTCQIAAAVLLQSQLVVLYARLVVGKRVVRNHLEDDFGIFF